MAMESCLRHKITPQKGDVSTPTGIIKQSGIDRGYIAVSFRQDFYSLRRLEFSKVTVKNTKRNWHSGLFFFESILYYKEVRCGFSKICITCYLGCFLQSCIVCVIL